MGVRRIEAAPDLIERDIIRRNQHLAPGGPGGGTGVVGQFEWGIFSTTKHVLTSLLYGV